MVFAKGLRPTQRQVVRLTRQDLYEKMWSRSVTSLAEEFGISGRALCNPLPDDRRVGQAEKVLLLDEIS